MKKQINYRLLAILFAALAVTAGATFLLHSWQMRRHARTLLAQACQAEADGRLDQAIVRLRRYLVFAPKDNATRVRYGEILEQLATSNHERWRTVAVYEQALYQEPSRHDIRRRLALLAARLGWYTEASRHLEVLLREQPGQAELETLLGQCQEAAGDYPRAVASYQNALRDDPAQVGAYLRLADLLQYRVDQPEKVGRVLDDLVTNNGRSVEAYLARARHRMNHGSPADAGRDMDRARELAPDEPRVLLAAAELARRRGQFDEARRCLRHGREKNPRHVALHLALAALELRCDKPSDAVACLRQGLETLPDQPELLHLLAETLLESGDEHAAEEVIQRLRRAGAPPGLAHYLDGRLRMTRRQWNEAIRTLEEVVQSPASAGRGQSRRTRPRPLPRAAGR